MAQIFAIKDTEAFLAQGSVFRKVSGPVNASACIVLSSIDGLDVLVERGIVEPVSPPNYTEDDKRAFIRDYTGFIASLNKLNQDKFLWWATDISSKNRYTSPLPDLVQELWEIEQAIQACGEKSVLLVAPSLAIHEALRKALAKHGRQLIWPGAPRQAFLRCAADAFREFCRTFYRALRFYGRTLLSHVALRAMARHRLSKTKKYYVIKTFSYPSSWDHQGHYTDPFFGRLPYLMSEDKNVLVWSYHWTGYQDFIKRILAQKDLCILPVEFFLKLKDILGTIFKILTFRVPVQEGLSFRGLDVSDILRYELARTMNGVQIFQLLHYNATRNLLKSLHVETFLFTFENNPWERMCMLACRDHSPSTKVSGYQHAVVPQAALNMFVHPSEKDIVPMPFRVLTTGEISKNIMQDYGDYSNASVMSACALRYEYLFSIKPSSRQKSQGRILLVLDGIEQTQLMLRFILEQLGGNSHYRLRIRCHPALPWNLLSNKFRFDISRYANAEVSKGTLQEDLEWSDMIIYWQSTVVLEAMNMGKPAINFKTDDILSYDPLFQSDALKWTVTQQAHLLDVIAAIEDMDEDSYQKQLTQALAYIKRYFSPVSPLALDFFRFDSLKALH